MDFTTLSLEIGEDGIAVLTLNRPEFINAINMQMIDEFNAAMDQLNRAFDTRILIITGADRPDGRPAFSAGLDVKEFDLKEANIVDEKKWPEGGPDWLDFPDPSKRFFQFQKESLDTHHVQGDIAVRHLDQPFALRVRQNPLGGIREPACLGQGFRTKMELRLTKMIRPSTLFSSHLPAPVSRDGHHTMRAGDPCSRMRPPRKGWIMDSFD
jgi:hypothetical protein